MSLLFFGIFISISFSINLNVYAEAYQNKPITKETNILNKNDHEFLRRIKVIRKCVDPNWMPLEEINSANQHIGIIADILALVENEIKLTIKLVPTQSWPESMAKLKSKECDIVTSDSINGIVPKHAIKTQPFLTLKNVFITRNDAPLNLNFSMIKNKTIGIPKGYPTIELIKKRYGNVNLVEVNTVDEGLLMVSKGQLYAFTDLLPTCSYSIQRQGLSNLKIAGHLDISMPTVMAVRSDMPELVSILNKVFATIDDITMHQLLSRWMKVEYDLKFNWQENRNVFLTILFFLVLLLYWNRRLQNLNNQLDKANKKLSLLNETDALTKIKNRNYMSNSLPGLISLASRNNLSLSIAMLDIDKFKNLNDQYGHATGDKCLIAFSDKMHKLFYRESDGVIRYGGEEFLLICIGMNINEFSAALEELRREVETIMVNVDIQQSAKFTVSIGYTFHPVTPSAWSETLIHKADKNLYKAKKSGRNCVIGSTTNIIK